jgi:ABC-type oligopeptide transport system substrate-binding subunit
LTWEKEARQVQFSRKPTTVFAVGLAVALGATACGGSSSKPKATGNANAIIIANSSEPQNPLLPANTNETGGGRAMQLLFRGLIDYDSSGKPRNQVADSITSADGQNYTVKLKTGWAFSNGEKVTAKSFVDAWNFGALVTNAQLNSFFFEPIAGYSAVNPADPTPDVTTDPLPKPTAKVLSGLKVVDDSTFTIKLVKPQASFPLRLGYTAFYPLPSAAIADPKKFGQAPVGNGPYVMDGAWQHKVQIKTKKNPTYAGTDKPQNGGVTLKFYQSADSAYTDLRANNLDVIDLLPPSAFKSFAADLGSRAINQPAGVFQSFSFPLYNAKFKGPNAAKVRQAISMAIDRPLVTKTIFNGTRTPAVDFSSPVINPGYDPSICGDFCTFQPEKAKALLKEAGGLPGNKMTIAYNTDGGHKAWVDAVCNSIKNTLGIICEGKAYADFKSLRDPITKKVMDSAFRTGWQMDYPSLDNFLGPIYAKGAGSNDSLYDNPAFDALLKKGDTAASTADAIKAYQDAERLLVKDMPAIPLWYSNSTGGYATTVSNVKFDVFGVPLYTQITKK